MRLGEDGARHRCHRAEVTRAGRESRVSESAGTSRGVMRLAAGCWVSSCGMFAGDASVEVVVTQSDDCIRCGGVHVVWGLGLLWGLIGMAGL